MVRGAEADVRDLLAVAAMLDDEVGAAGDRQRADLSDVRSVFERAGRDGFVEEEGFFFELERGDEHRLSVGRQGVQVNGTVGGESAWVQG